MLTIHVWPRWLKEFLLTHPLYKSPNATPLRSNRAKIAAHNAHGRKPGFLFSRKERKGRKVFSAAVRVLGFLWDRL